MIRRPLIESACSGFSVTLSCIISCWLAGSPQSSPTRPTASLHYISPLNMSPAVLTWNAALEDSPAEAKGAVEGNSLSRKGDVVRAL
ncbi:unnamed protein product [Lota lota]